MNSHMRVHTYELVCDQSIDTNSYATIWHNAEIAKERMHPNDYHLIEHHKALLPTFENDKDDISKIDVGVDVDKKE